MIIVEDRTGIHIEPDKLDVTHKHIPNFIVICRGDTKEDGSPGDYELATRSIFATKELAEWFKGTCSDSRYPMVISGNFDELRFDAEDRFAGIRKPVEKE